MNCYCSRCCPTPASAQCSACGQEIRLGVREGRRDWWHRELVDHVPVHGHRFTETNQGASQDVTSAPIPGPEVTSTSIEMNDPRLPAGAKSIWKLAEAQGWRIYRATYSRGPVTHGTTGELLRIADFVVLGIVLDDQGLFGVGSWCDSKFDFAYVGKVGPTITPRKINSRDWKSLIKGETT